MLHFLRSLTLSLLFAGLFVLFSPELKSQNVLILYDNSATNSNTLALRSSLISAGFSVTISSVSESSWNNTNPSLSSFDAVIHLNGTSYANDMPTAGQSALVNFVNNQDGLYVHFEWNAYQYDTQNELQLMQNLILFERSSGATGTITLAKLSSQASHPVMAGIPNTFSITAGYNNGSLRTFSSSPSTLLMQQGTNPAVAVRDYGTGHILGFHNAGNYEGNNVLSNTNIQQIIINFINTYHCASANPTVTNVDCNGDATGAITTSASGGTSPYTYSWSNGATTAAISGLTAGAYSVTISDNTGCTNVQSMTVTEPSALAGSISGTNATCNGANDGAISTSVSGGTPGYTYSWSNGATTSSLSSIGGGTYTVTVSDNNGCTMTLSTSIVEPIVLLASANASNITCAGFNDGAITAIASGGTTPYTYTWSTGATAASIAGLTAGTYTVTITDNNGCADAETTTIINPPSFTASITSSTNVSCNGLLDGAASATANGGVTPYTYNWSSGATGANLTFLGAGTYTLTVTDNYGCTDTDVLTITEPPAITASISTTSPSCGSNADGSASAPAGGGAGPYTYSWNTGSSSVTASGLTAGFYTVTITDNSGCTNVFNATVSQSNSFSLTASNTSISCNGLADGAATVTPSGGLSPYTYIWSNGSTNASISGLAAGTYTVTATGNNGCTQVTSTTISEPSAVVAAMSSINNACNGSSSGSATVGASGGTTPYTYVWSTGSTSSTISSLNAGNYTVTVTDNNGCTDTEVAAITQPQSISASISSTTNLSCNASGDGTATATVSGGSGPYSYLWSNGATNTTATNLSATTYTVTITSNSGCTSTAAATLTQPSAIVIPTMTRVSVSCNSGSDGSITANPIGGTSPYSYQWSNGATSQTNSGLAIGAYTVTVTDDIGCTKTANRTMTQPAVLNANMIETSVSCYAGADGALAASSNGGTSPYSYQWSTGATTASISGLTASTYFVTVTDNNGCIDIESQTVTQPSALAATISSSNVTCNGLSNGSATASGSGGTQPYNYTWSNSGTSAAISSIPAGVYTVTLTDVNGCTDVESVSISQPTALVANVNSSTNVSCNGGNSGLAIASVSGGTSPYSYLWSDATTNAAATSLGAGNYAVTVTDNNGCTSNSSVTITQPAALSLSATQTSSVSCNGNSDGAAQVSVSGGTSPYSYAWSNGSSQATVSNLTAGTYSVTVTDNNGCTQSDIVSVTQPTSVTATIASSNNILCNGGSSGLATVAASGGTSPYAYSWSNGATSSSTTGLTAGNYTITVTDNNGCTDAESVTLTQPTSLTATLASSSNVSCNGSNDGTALVSVSGGTTPYSYNWSNGSTSTNQTSLAAGTYTMTATDNNGCTAIESVTITQPSAFSVSASTGTDVSCFGGSDGVASASASGGVTPYSFLWSTGGTNSAVGGLTAGTYGVTVIDDNGCSDIASITVSQPTLLNTSIAASNVLCNGGSSGSATASGSGGTTPYTYAWSTSASTAGITSLVAGTYTVTTTDNNACTTTQFIIITEPTALSASNTTLDVSCFGGNDGEAQVTASGGTIPYSYLWSNAATSATTGSLAAGAYTVTVTDDNGCTQVASSTIDEPTQLVLSADVNSHPSCFGFSDGEASVAANGGVTPYAFAWSNSATTASVSGLEEGTYTVLVTDDNGCMETESVTLVDPTPLMGSAAVVDHVSCNSFADAEVNVSVGGATPPYSYQWSNGETNAVINGLTAGNYAVVVTDSNGCVISDSVTVTQPDSLLLTLAAEDVTCFGGDDGWVSSMVTGGVMPHVYAWNTGATIDLLDSIQSGWYVLTVTDTNGCMITDSAEVGHQHELPVVDLGPDSTFCDSVELVLDAQNPGAEYLWYNGAVTQTLSVFDSAAFWVEVTDTNGCLNSDTVNIHIRICVGVEEVAETIPVKLYPNPTRDLLHLLPGKTIGEDVSIIIRSINGAMVDQREGVRLTGNVPYVIDMSSQAAGSYIIQIVTPSHSSVHRVMVN